MRALYLLLVGFLVAVAAQDTWLFNAASVDSKGDISHEPMVRQGHEHTLMSPENDWDDDDKREEQEAKLEAREQMNVETREWDTGEEIAEAKDKLKIGADTQAREAKSVKRAEERLHQAQTADADERRVELSIAKAKLKLSAEATEKLKMNAGPQAREASSWLSFSWWFAPPTMALFVIVMLVAAALQWQRTSIPDARASAMQFVATQAEKLYPTGAKPQAPST